MDFPQYQPDKAQYTPLTDDELSDLDDFLSELDNDAALNIEALDGYLSARGMERLEESAGIEGRESGGGCRLVSVIHSIQSHDARIGKLPGKPRAWRARRGCASRARR